MKNSKVKLRPVDFSPTSISRIPVLDKHGPSVATNDKKTGSITSEASPSGYNPNDEEHSDPADDRSVSGDEKKTASHSSSKQDGIIVHNPDAFALLVGDDCTVLSDHEEFDRIEEEIDGTKDEIIVPGTIKNNSVKIQNAELLKLMFGNYTPLSTNYIHNGKRDQSADKVHTTEIYSNNQQFSPTGQKIKSKKPFSNENGAQIDLKLSREMSNYSSRNKYNSLLNSSSRPSSRDRPSNMVPIAGRRETIETSQQNTGNKISTISKVDISDRHRHGISTDQQIIGPLSNKTLTDTSSNSKHENLKRTSSSGGKFGRRLRRAQSAASSPPLIQSSYAALSTRKQKIKQHKKKNKFKKK